jgi:arylsulfatase A-like enzyme
MPPFRAGSALVRVVLVVALGCGGREPPAPPPGELVRVLDAAPADAPSVALGDVWRPVLTRSARLDLALRRDESVPADHRRTYDVMLPAGPTVSAMVARTFVHAAGAKDWWQTALVPVAGGRAQITVDFADLPADRTVDVAVTGYAASALDLHDVTTAPFVVPAGARLELAVGVQPEAWELAVPLRFAVREGERELWSAVLDPAQHPDDRRWRPATIPLDALAGRSAQLRFEVRPLDPKGEATSLPLWADPVVIAPGAAPSPPNVLLISLDTLRADAVGAYGARFPTTPRIDADLVRRGTLFEQAIAPFPLTLPSHLSIMTGLYHRTHGVRRLGEALAPSMTTLASALRSAGYATAAFTEDGFLFAESGVDRGFGLYDENKAAQGTGLVSETFGRGIAWLRAHADRRFFLFLHTYQVHAPYYPPEAYRSLFADIGTLPSGVERDRLRYLQETRVADDAVGQVLDALDELGLARDTLVVLLADHGEEFLEHGQRFHGYQLYEETLRVPLVLRWPGHVPAGARVAGIVSLVDVMPTILHLAQAPAPRMDGMSLVPLLPPGELALRSPVFSEAGSAETVHTTDLVRARSTSHACTRHVTSGELECYDLAHDAGERSRLPADAVPASLVQALDAFVARPARTSATAGTGPDAATRRNLEALGYAVGDDGTVGPAPGN